jgi:hypothetical protein
MHFISRFVQGLALGEWGCNDLRFIVNVGGDVSISPITIRASSMTASGLQQLHLSSRRTYRSMVGPHRSRRGRLTPRQRRREPFTSPVVGIVPPLLLQQRESVKKASFRSDGDSHQCEVVRARLLISPYYLSVSYMHDFQMYRVLT